MGTLNELTFVNEFAITLQILIKIQGLLSAGAFPLFPLFSFFLRVMSHEHSLIIGLGNVEAWCYFNKNISLKARALK